MLRRGVPSGFHADAEAFDGVPGAVVDLQENQTRAAPRQDLARRNAVGRLLTLLRAPGKASREIRFQLSSSRSGLLVAEAAGDVRRTSPLAAVEAPRSNQTCPSCRRASVNDSCCWAGLPSVVLRSLQ